MSIEIAYPNTALALSQAPLALSDYQFAKRNISGAAVLMALGREGYKSSVYYVFQCPVGPHTKGKFNFLVCPNGLIKCRGCGWEGDVIDLWYELNPSNCSWYGPFETAWSRKLAVKELIEWHKRGRFANLPQPRAGVSQDGGVYFGARKRYLSKCSHPGSDAA